MSEAHESPAVSKQLETLVNEFSTVLEELRRTAETQQMGLSPDQILLDFDRVERLTGLSRSSIYRREQQGTFPARIPVAGRPRWQLSKVTQWLQEAIDEGGKP